MRNDDFDWKARRYQSQKKALNEAPFPEANKALTMEFLETCMVGMAGKKIGIRRAEKTLGCLRNLCKLLPEGKNWHDITRADVKSLLFKIHENSNWGEWEKHTISIILRKFMTWLRTEHGYPESYPDREKMTSMLMMSQYAPEVKFNIPRPTKLKPLDEIPTEQEIRWLIEACDTYRNKTKAARDKAIIAILEDVGLRIGGLGSLQIKDVLFDSLGARITVHDKTMRGEPVRIIKSAPYLREWLDVHPLKDNPEAPLWVNLSDPSSDNFGRNRINQSLDYYGMYNALKKAVRVHNKYAKEKGLSPITRRMHFHAFRYFAQTRDMVGGMPVSIQCLQRGWKPNSKQPMQYARVSTAQADEWLAKHHRLGNLAEAESIGRQS